jgi:hypothetical protein
LLYVILDANAIGVDPPLGKLGHRLLLDAHRSGDLVLVVPRLALREAVNVWKWQVKTQTDKLAKVAQQLRELLPSQDWRSPTVDLDDAADRLHRELYDALEATGVATPDTPDVSHEELLNRALNRRQPFDQHGSGYRDALLWHIVRHYASLGHHVVLISNDPAAFAEGRKKGAPLALNLANELTGGGSACLYANMSEAIEKLGVVQPEALDATREVIERVGGDFADMLRDRLLKDLSHPVPAWLTRELVNPFVVSGVSLGVAYEALGAVADEARRMEDGWLEASVVLRVRQWLTVWLAASVADHVESFGQVIRTDEDGINVALNVDATVEHCCRVVLDPMTDRLVSAEALDVISAAP